MLATRFEELQMKKDEIVEAFNKELSDTVNQAHQLVKIIPKRN